MDENARAGALAHRVRGPRVVAIGEEDRRDIQPRDPGQPVVARRHRIDAQAALVAADEVTVEVVAVRLGKGRPREYVGNDFAHGGDSDGCDDDVPILAMTRRLNESPITGGSGEA